MACQAVSEFLSGLPSRDPHNFERWSTDGPKQNVTRRPQSYIPTKDNSSENTQIIVTEKTNILLRYLHQQFEKKAKNVPKREGGLTEEESQSQRKRPRYD